MVYDRQRELDEAVVKVLNDNKKQMKELKKQIKVQSKFVLLTTGGFLTCLGTSVYLYLKYVM